MKRTSGNAQTAEEWALREYWLHTYGEGVTRSGPALAAPP
jgi:hypothetical protein